MLAQAPISVTAVRDPDEIWRVHVEDALTALPLVERTRPASMVDVGSGGGSPGIPLGLVSSLPVALIEARAAKAAFLRAVAARVGGHFEVIDQRSETFARGAGRDAYDLALARALAPPPAAAELCLPLVRGGGHVILWTANLDAGAVDAAARCVAGELVEVLPTGGARALALLRKTGPTPAGYPRRPGMARRRPLGSVPSRM
jgi:16S rRNA (guanine527-N7)-methyltransferase